MSNIFVLLYYKSLGDSSKIPILIPSSAKRIAKQILAIAKLNRRKDLVLSGCFYDLIFSNKQLSVQN